jgi:hypothetical protein
LVYAHDVNILGGRVCTIQKNTKALVVTSKEINLEARWAGHVAHMGERRGVYRVLVGKPQGTRPLERPRHRWEDIKIDVQEVGCGGTHTGLIWLRTGTGECSDEPSGAIKCREFFD